MASTTNSTRAEPLFDDGAVATVTDAAPTVPKAAPGGVEETLAKLAHQAAIAAPDLRSRAAGTDTPSAAPTLGAATHDPIAHGPTTHDPAMGGAATLGAADLSTHFPLDQPASGKRRTLVRVAMVVCVGAAALWAWRSYGGPLREVVATLTSPTRVAAAPPAAEQPPVARTLDTPNSPPATAPAPAQAVAPALPAAPAPDRHQLDAMAHDVAALRQTVAQLTAGQAQLKDEVAKLQAEKLQAEKVAAAKPPAKPKKHVAHHVPPGERPHDAFDPALDPRAPGAPHTIGAVVQRRPAPPPSSAYPVSTVSSLPPPPGTPEPRRPPAPVPQY